MLHLEHLRDQLDKRREDFTDFDRSQQAVLSDYLAVLRSISNKTHTEVLEEISGDEGVGAIPSGEIDKLSGFAVEFEQSWLNHEEARSWASEVLENRTTFAADGSQYYSEKDASLPVGAIQIGWFENPHDAGRPYEKDSKLKVLTPKDLLEDQKEPMQPDSRVNEARFKGEVEKVGEFLSKSKGWQERDERMPLAFFDGTLLVSFSLPHSDLQKLFVQQLVELVRHSRDVEVPFIGYVDRSFSRDIVRLVESFAGEGSQSLYDGYLLKPRPSGSQSVLRNWGDRTPFCYSKRKGLEAFVDGKTDMPLVGFTYLQTSGDSIPARLDVPAWVYEAGLLDELSDVVRAECVVGLGYPYPLETADQTAVITSRDREIFLKTLQEFAKKNNLNFSVSRKSASKGRRR